MRRTPSITAKHYDELAHADANGSVSDDADIEDVADEKVYGYLCQRLCAESMLRR
jgi:hypothetical protein